MFYHQLLDKIPKGIQGMINLNSNNYINDKNCPLPFNERRGGGINNMIILWISLLGLISKCMFCSVSENKILDVILFIKIFLSSMDSLDEYLNNSSTNETWFTSIEIGRVDINTEIPILSSYQAALRQGYLEQLLHIVAFLKKKPKLTLSFDHTQMILNDSIFSGSER